MPYALRFHLVARDEVPLARFATAWAAAFASLPGWKPPGYQHPEYEDDSWIRYRGYTDTPTTWTLP